MLLGDVRGEAVRRDLLAAEPAEGLAGRDVNALHCIASMSACRLDVKHECFSGIVTTTMSPAFAASTTIAARACGPSSATSKVNVSGPRELLMPESRRFFSFGTS